MALTAARWLVDTSAISRLHHSKVADVLHPLMTAGLLGVSLVTELEVGYSARSTEHFRLIREKLLDRLLPVAIPLRAEGRARQVQTELVARGQHRSASVADLLVAATAELERLTVLHYDADFETIAEVTGQRTEWVLPRGTVP